MESASGRLWARRNAWGVWSDDTTIHQSARGRCDAESGRRRVSDGGPYKAVECHRGKPAETQGGRPTTTSLCGGGCSLFRPSMTCHGSRLPLERAPAALPYTGPIECPGGQSAVGLTCFIREAFAPGCRDCLWEASFPQQTGWAGATTPPRGPACFPTFRLFLPEGRFSFRVPQFHP